MIIAIDGPSGTGKSTVAKRLAERIGFLYLDSGALYRCLTWALFKEEVDWKENQQLALFLERFQLDMRVGENGWHYFYRDEEITSSIRGQRVTEAVSEVAALAAVRHKLIELQRKVAEKCDLVAEGRDMGSVVFPEAQLKIFLTATAEVRAQRRFDEWQRKRPEEIRGETVETIMEKINRRDHRDSTRNHSPLKQVADAHLLDTSYLTIDQVVDAIISLKEC